MAEQHRARGRTGGLFVPSTALWASAFVLAGMVLLRAMDIGPAPAVAGSLGAWDMTASADAYAMMTTSVGDEELLYVIDNHSESLFVYRVENRERFELLERRALPELFAVMRARSR